MFRNLAKNRAHLARGGDAFLRLSAMNGKDMLRNPLIGFSMLFMFLTIVSVYVSMWLAFTVVGPAPAAVVNSSDAQLTEALGRAGVSIVGADATVQNAVITIQSKRVLVVLDASDQPAWNPIWMGLRDAGFAPHVITVVDSEGDMKLDLLRVNLGVAAMLGIASIAFIGTTVPLVALRERGLLRLFGTTPLRRWTFLLAQLPARIVMVVALLSTTIALALWRRYIDGVDMAGLGITFLLGAAMLLSFGLLCATRSRNAEATQHGMAMLTIMLVFASGGLVPPSILPAAVQIAMNCLPTTWVAAAASASLTGSEPFLPLPTLWALMVLGTACAAAVAARLFEWDQSEPRRTAPTKHREKAQTQ